ncbi:MAG: tetratricopeptide repeat protein [Promethearchaeota archaeon]
MAWIVRLAIALVILGRESGINTGPLTEKEIILLKKEKTFLLSRAEEAFSKGLFEEARDLLMNAISLEKINPENTPESISELKKKIEIVENRINRDQLNQLIIILEKGDNYKTEGQIQEAISEYQKAFNVIKVMKIYDQDLRETRTNEIYLKQINCQLEEGIRLRKSNSHEAAFEIINNALEIAERMYPTAEKKRIIKEIDKILDIYSDIVKKQIKAGIELMQKSQFEESMKIFQNVENLIKEKYRKLPNTMTNRFNEAKELREINRLIEDSISGIISDINNVSLLNEDSTEKLNIEKNGELNQPEKKNRPKASIFICSFCGIKMKEKPRFCPNCGVKW